MVNMGNIIPASHQHVVTVSMSHAGVKCSLTELGRLSTLVQKPSFNI